MHLQPGEHDVRSREQLSDRVRYIGETLRIYDDAIVTMLIGSTNTGRYQATAVKELKQALGQFPARRSSRAMSTGEHAAGVPALINGPAAILILRRLAIERRKSRNPDAAALRLVHGELPVGS